MIQVATTIIVLNDGETYTLAEGCKIMTVYTDELERMEEEGRKIKDLNELAVLSTMTLD